MKPTAAEREVFRGINIWIDDPVDRLTAKIAYIDARQGVPADDLREMGIARADLRWEAVRGYIHVESERALRDFRRAWLFVVAGGMMQQASELRGKAGWIGKFDILDTVARIKRFFGQRAAKIVADEFMPPEFREPK